MSFKNLTLRELQISIAQDPNSDFHEIFQGSIVAKLNELQNSFKSPHLAPVYTFPGSFELKFIQFNVIKIFSPKNKAKLCYKAKSKNFKIP